MDANTDNYIENLIFFYVIKNYSLASKFQEKYFSQDKLRKLFSVIKPHIMTYQDEPNEGLVNTLVRQNGQYTAELSPDIIHSLWDLRSHLSQYSEEWLKETAYGYAEWNNFITGVQKMHGYLMTTQYDVTPETAHDYVQKVKLMFGSDTNFIMNESMGHDFFDPKEHKMSIVETRPTGYKFFDLCLRGGWAKKTFNVIMGPPKVGKSMWLCNLCANSVSNGDDCAYITLEMSAELVNQRIGANLLNIPINEYEKYAADEAVMMQKLRDFQTGAYPKSRGCLVVEEFPTSSATVYDIESFLLNVEKNRSTDTKPFKFKNVYIDYVNIMADARHGAAADTYIKIKGICEDLRAMAQRNDWCVVSLTQTNRQGMNASDLDMTAVSESSGLVATVDALFGIICTTMMKVESVYYIKALALRNSPHMGDKKKYTFSGDYLRIKEDPTEEIIPDGIQLPSELTNASNSSGGNGDNNRRGTWTPRSNQTPPANNPNNTVPPAGLPETPGIQINEPAIQQKPAIQSTTFKPGFGDNPLKAGRMNTPFGSNSGLFGL